MIHDIAAILIHYLKPLPFIDKLAGVVKTVEEGTGTEVKRYPAAYHVVEKEASSKDFEQLVPDSKKASILYFEDQGTTLLGMEKANLQFESTLFLIGWLNSDKIHISGHVVDYGSLQALAIAYILAAFPETVPNNLIDFTIKYHSVHISVTRILPADKNLFRNYTYDERIRQFLLPPYCAFGLELKVRFAIAKQCLPTVATPNLAEYSIDYITDYSS